MAEEKKNSEIRVGSEGTVEKFVAEHSSMKKKKKKKKIRENKDSFAGEAGEIAAREREKLGDDAVVKKKSKKKTVDSEAEDDGRKSKKKNKEIKFGSEAEEDVKKSKAENKEIKVDSEADDGVWKSKKKKEGVDSDPEDGVKKSKKKSKESEGDDDGKRRKKKEKKKQKECGGVEIGSFEENQRDGELLVNTNDAKRETGKRKRDDSDSGAEEDTEKSNEEVKRKSKKKKQNVEANNESMNDSKKEKTKKKKNKQTEDLEAEENKNEGREDANKKRKKKQNGIKDVTSPSSKSTKKVKFSDQVEVFPSDDEEREVEVVKGKRFTKEEDELIKKAVSEYIENHALGDEGLKMVLECASYPEVKGCWREIESALPWRTPSGVYHRAHTIFEAGSQGKWTKEDFELLKEYQKKHGNDWKTLADAMGKHRKHVKDAWRRIRLNTNKGHWSREEYQNLFDLVNTDLRMKAYQEKHTKHGMLRDNIPWMAISDQLGTRDHTICCIKWYDQLTSPMVAKGIWENVDDYRLLDELTKLDAACVDDVDWDNLLENRDGEACRMRWNQMVRHIGIPGTKTFAEQVEILSERYCPDLAEDREDFDNRPFDPED